ncbi:MAG: hypothetical protein LBH40_01360 [Alphaproteobacteria bacterium]|jgi:hypothetical protein|nr:hypothetical protein [Alphaproteobacteria bacterium]
MKVFLKLILKLSIYLLLILPFIFTSKGNAIEYTRENSFFETMISKYFKEADSQENIKKKQYYQNRETLDSIGKKYNTNPYPLNNNKNSLIIYYNTPLQHNMLFDYSDNGIINDNSSNSFKITTQYSIVYLRKISPKVSVGVEIGKTNQATASFNETFAVNSLSTILEKEGRLNVGTDNLCTYLQQGVNTVLQSLCNEQNGSLTSCNVYQHKPAGTPCYDGVINNNDICNVYGYYCSGGVLVDPEGVCKAMFNSIDATIKSGFTVMYENGKCMLTPIIIPFVCDPSSVAHQQGLCQKPDIGNPPVVPPEVCDPSSPAHNQDLCQNPDITNPSVYVCNPDSAYHDQSLCEEININNPSKNNTSVALNSYTAMFLINYELLKINKFGLAVESGIGANYREIRLRGAISDGDKSISLAGKTGLVGSYYFTNNLALDIGTHYVVNRKSEFKGLAKTSRFQGYNLEIKDQKSIFCKLGIRFTF